MTRMIVAILIITLLVVGLGALMIGRSLSKAGQLDGSATEEQLPA